MTPRHLFIITRDAQGLYEVLAAQFADEEDVQVVLDRRIGERRAAHQPASPDRRGADRRTRPHVDEEVRTRAHAILTLPND